MRSNAISDNRNRAARRYAQASRGERDYAPRKLAAPAPANVQPAMRVTVRPLDLEDQARAMIAQGLW